MNSEREIELADKKRKADYIELKSNVDNPQAEDVKVKEEIGFIVQTNEVPYDNKQIKGGIFFYLNFLPLLISIISYVVGLKGCYDEFYICVITFERFIVDKYLVPSVFICTIFLYIQILIIKYKLNDQLTKNHYKYYFLIAFILLLFFSLDRGSNFSHHGAFNFLVIVSLLILSYIIETFIFYCIKSYSRNKRVFILVVGNLAIVLFVIYLILSHKLSESCTNWDIGFNGTRIDNSNTSCRILKPKKCMMTTMSGMFNYSYYTHSNCSSLFKGDYEKVREVISDKSAKVIGFPRTNNWNWELDSQRKYYNYRVRKEMINMEDPSISNEIKENIEAIIDFNKNPPELNVNLKFNKTLSDERKKKFEENKNETVFSSNILLFYIDSLSRVDFQRKLPNFYKYLEKYYKNDKYETEIFQFFKYHAMGRFTLLNNLPAFWGAYTIDSKNAKFFIESYKNRGYVTGTSQNHCSRETVPSDDIKPVHYSGYDHELNGITCDPNNESVNNTLSMFHGANSMVPRCLYGRHTAEYGMDYTLQFWDKYSDNAKFFYLGSMDNHEPTAEGISLLDHKFINFFKEFENKGYSKNTTIIIQSDHGHAFFSFYNVMRAQDHYQELVLPLLYLMVPKSLEKFNEVKETLLHNENSLITPFTIYNTYHALIGNFVEKATHSKYNFLYDKIPHSDNCDQFYDKEYFSLAEYLCRCN